MTPTLRDSEAPWQLSASYPGSPPPAGRASSPCAFLPVLPRGHRAQRASLSESIPCSMEALSWQGVARQQLRPHRTGVSRPGGSKGSRALLPEAARRPPGGGGEGLSPTAGQLSGW